MVRVRADRLEQLQYLPIFPLPGMTFFPDTLLPLHVFEPRYRALARFCIDRDWPMAVVGIRAGHEAEHLGRPPVEAVCGVGELLHHEALPDGRFHVLLRGLERVRIREELRSETAFRVVRAEPMPDAWPEDRRALEARVETLRQCLAALAQHAPALRPLLQRPDEADSSAAALTHQIAAAVVGDVAQRQALLECVAVEDRVEWLLSHISRLLIELADSGPRH